MGHADTVAIKPLLMDKACGCAVPTCPYQMKDLWAKAHLTVAYWDEFMEHPTDNYKRGKMHEQIVALRAAARLAEPVMEVRLRPEYRGADGANPDCV